MALKENFFVIDSDNLQDVESRLYGFCIASVPGGVNGLLDDLDFYTKTHNGAFVLVQSDASKVFVSQDFMGSYGLFLFQKNGYFALSNSFLCLFEHVKTRFSLTPNLDYMKDLLFQGLSGTCCVDTMVNEIEMLPRVVSVVIDKASKKISMHKKEVQEELIPMDSKEGVETLDEWFCYWTSFIRNIVAKSDKVSVDLSGGLDSRLVFLLFLCAGIDFDKVCIRSVDGVVHTFKDDYAISSEIAEHYGLSLNKPIKTEKFNVPLRDTVDLSFYLKLHRHKEMYFHSTCLKEPRLLFGVGGGETIRRYDSFTLGSAINRVKYSKKNLWAEMASGVEKTLLNSKKALEEIYGNMEGTMFGHCLYKNGVARHHNGVIGAEYALYNSVYITPLLDFALHKLRFPAENPTLLLALIYTRYLPDLMNFRYVKGRFIDQSAIDKAKVINQKFPFDKNAGRSDAFQNMDLVFDFEAVSSAFANEDVSNRTENDAVDWCKKIFHSDFVKENFCSVFPKRFYKYADDYIKTHGHHPLSEAYPVIAIAHILFETNPENKAERHESIYGFLEKVASDSVGAVVPPVFNSLKQRTKQNPFKRVWFFFGLVMKKLLGEQRFFHLVETSAMY